MPEPSKEETAGTQGALGASAVAPDNAERVKAVRTAGISSETCAVPAHTQAQPSSALLEGAASPVVDVALGRGVMRGRATSSADPESRQREQERRVGPAAQPELIPPVRDGKALRLTATGGGRMPTHLEAAAGAAVPTPHRVPDRHRATRTSEPPTVVIEHLS